MEFEKLLLISNLIGWRDILEIYFKDIDMQSSVEFVNYVDTLKPCDYNFHFKNISVW